ncbi:hypothetical protein QFC20_004313 [Naganishia adeliensis]|uniref:Uncharacterized protein n=1 Tax=Naganishia adeliensis TaxID=92952 RepID=A0ACC2W2L6_9TREE|nr:hypothetical protein QFC20_004313 [Naganishia adeliensis]
MSGRQSKAPTTPTRRGARSWIRCNVWKRGRAGQEAVTAKLGSDVSGDEGYPKDGGSEGDYRSITSAGPEYTEGIPESISKDGSDDDDWLSVGGKSERTFESLAPSGASIEKQKRSRRNGRDGSQSRYQSLAASLNSLWNKQLPGYKPKDPLMKKNLLQGNAQPPTKPPISPADWEAVTLQRKPLSPQFVKDGPASPQA